MRYSRRHILAAWRRVRSVALLTFYRMIYPTLRVGRGVYLGRDVSILIWDGGSISIGDHTEIDSCARLEAEGSLVIGPHGYVGIGSQITAIEEIEIGRDALIASYVTIRDQNHRSDDLTKPYRSQGWVTSPVRIGNNVWLGTKATILRGVTIGDNAIVGANSVVTKDLEADCVAVGAPAKFVKRLPPRAAGLQAKVKRGRSIR